MTQGTPSPPLRSVEWWQAQALKITGGRCLKCRGFTEGCYVPPTVESSYECAIVERCRLCGWDHVVVTGQANSPTGARARPLTHLKPVGVPGGLANRRMTSNEYKRLRAGKKPAEQKTRYHE